jgi:hypothetical protein
MAERFAGRKSRPAAAQHGARHDAVSIATRWDSMSLRQQRAPALIRNERMVHRLTD